MTIGELILELQKLDQTRLVMIEMSDAIYSVEAIRECTVSFNDPGCGGVEIDNHEDEYDEDSTYLAVVLS